MERSEWVIISRQDLLPKESAEPDPAENRVCSGISQIVRRKRSLGECIVEGSYCDASHPAIGADLKESKGGCCIPRKIQTSLLLLSVALDSNQSA